MNVSGHSMRVFDFRDPKQKRTALIQRHGALKSERTTWRTHWAELSRYLLPRQGRFFVTDRNLTSENRYNRIYDNTGTRALRTLAAGMQAGVTNPSRPWFKLTTSDPDLAEYYPVKMWLDDVVTRMRKVFEGSNTYRALHQMYAELGAFGTSVSIVLPDRQRLLHHYPVVCGEYCLQHDYQGRIVALYREFEKTVGAVVKEFGLDNCSRLVREQWNARNLENPVQILHVIEPRADQDRRPDSPFPEDMPWASIYLELGGDDEKILRESGFNRFPVLAPRWQVSGGDVYGHSPGMEALGDVKQLQQEQLRKGQAIDYMVRPPLQVPTNLKNRGEELFPGGVSYLDPGTTIGADQVGTTGGIRSAFEVRLDLSHLLEDIRDCRDRINSSFYADLFLMLATGDLRNMTATEIAERHEEKLLALGPVLERLHNEKLSPLIDMTFETMAEEGLLPPAPDELQGQDLGVEFVSILAQAQRAVGSNSVDRFVGNALSISEAKPEVLDKIDFDKWVDNYADMLGVDADLLLPQEDVDALRKARADAQAAEAQVAAQREQAAAARDLGTIDTAGANPVADAISQGNPEELV